MPDKSPDNEIIYKAINQSLNSMIYYKNISSIFPENQRRITKAIKKTINYPLILCNNFDLIYKVDSSLKEEIKIDDNLQLEINYAYLDTSKESKNEYFLIDIIEFNKFGEFLEELKKADIESIKNAISGEYRLSKG